MSITNIILLLRAIKKIPQKLKSWEFAIDTAPNFVKSLHNRVINKKAPTRGLLTSYIILNYKCSISLQRVREILFFIYAFHNTYPLPSSSHLNNSRATNSYQPAGKINMIRVR